MLLATLAMLAAAPANADSIKFFSGTTGYTGPFSGAGTVYQTIQNNPTACPGGGSACAGGDDIISTPQTFSGGITASAVTAVYNDLSPNFAGLGVQTVGNPADTDQIDVGELLTIHFNSAVKLTGVATLFDANHTPFGPGFPTNSNITDANTFLLNGVITTFDDANMALLALTGQDFTFAAIARTAKLLRRRPDLLRRTNPRRCLAVRQRHRRHRRADTAAQKKSVRNRSLIKDA